MRAVSFREGTVFLLGLGEEQGEHVDAAEMFVIIALQPCQFAGWELDVLLIWLISAFGTRNIHEKNVSFQIRGFQR